MKLQTSIGIFAENNGVLRNIQINLIESNAVSNTEINLFGWMNGATGIIENFVINMKEPIYGANHLYAVCRYNRGTIQNGYVYGKNIEAIMPLAEGQTREVSVITGQNYVKGTVKNVYTLASINTLKQDGVNEKIANLVYLVASGLKLENSYSVGIGNWEEFTKGPNTVSSASGTVENCYYFCDETFTNSVSKKTSMLALWDTNFQNQVLNKNGGEFNVDELVSKGYYPHINMPEVMPRQEYIPLPEVEDSDLADLLSIEILEQNENEATISCNIHNPSGENITEIKVENLETSIISQEYEDGVSKVILKLSNPKLCVSKYSVMSITTQGAFGTPYTRNYEQNERFMEIEFFRLIYNIQDWKEINQSPTENYKLMADLDFINNRYDVRISKTYSGKLDGNGYYIKNVNIEYLIVKLSGTIMNLNIENVKIKANVGGGSIIGVADAGSKLENIHIKNVEIENTGENMKVVGGIATTTGTAIIQNCSVRNINIKINDTKITTIGGLVGVSNNTNIYNSYVTGLNITADNVASTDGMGGIIGKLTGSGDIKNCYATRKYR